MGILYSVLNRDSRMVSPVLVSEEKDENGNSVTEVNDSHSVLQIDDSPPSFQEVLDDDMESEDVDLNKTSELIGFDTKS